MNIIQVLNSYHDLLDGLKITGELALTGMVAGLGLGSIIAMLRTSNNMFLSNLAKVYINFFRSVPLVLILIGLYLVIPRQLRQLGFYGDIALPSALISFALFESAYFAEILRSGINSISQPQLDAAKLFGFSKWKAYRLIILPQAFKKSLPSIVGQFKILFQDTSLVYVIGLSDFFTTIVHIGERDFNMDGSITVALVVYIAICVSISRFAKFLEKRLQQKLL